LEEREREREEKGERRKGMVTVVVLDTSDTPLELAWTKKAVDRSLIHFFSLLGSDLLPIF
jgi:hypothetical protein